MATRGKPCWVGFDLGGTKMMAAVFDRRWRCVGRRRDRTRGYEGARSGLDRLHETLAGALSADSPTLKSDIGILEDKIEALGVQFAEREHLITGAGR